MTDLVVRAVNLYRTLGQELAPVRALGGANLEVAAGDPVAVMRPLA